MHRPTHSRLTVGRRSPALRMLVAAALLIVSCAAAQEGAYDWSAARVLCPGIKHAAVKVTAPRLMAINCLQVDLKAPGLTFYTTPRCPDWEASVTETVRQTTRQFMREARADGKPVVVAVNGDWWEPWVPVTWNLPTVTKVGGLAVSDGVLVSPASGTVSFMVHNDGRAQIALTDANTDLSAVRTAISGFAIVLQDGVAATSGDDLHPRTCTGVSEDGWTAYLMTVDGRQEASGGASYPELGAWLKHFGAHTGANMDGGGSTTMVWWDEAREGEDKTVLLNVPVGSGRTPGTERCNGNNLGVCYQQTQR